MRLSLSLEALVLETDTNPHRNEQRAEKLTWMCRNPNTRKNTKTELCNNQDKKCTAEQLVSLRHSIYPMIKPTAFNVKENSLKYGANSRTLT